MDKERLKKLDKVLDELKEMDDDDNVVEHIVKSLDMDELCSFISFLIKSANEAEKKAEFYKNLLIMERG